MKHFQVIHLMIFLFLHPLYIHGQTKFNLPPKNDYDRATIGFRNSDRKHVSKLSITSDSLSYFLEKKKNSHALSEVEYIKVDEGHRYSIRGGLIGAALGLTISAASTWLSQNDPAISVNAGNAGTIVLSTAGGAALGALVGSVIKVKSTYYIHEVEPHK